MYTVSPQDKSWRTTTEVSPVRHHVQYGTEHGALVVLARGPSVERVQETAQQVRGARQPEMGGHEIERYERQHDPGIACGVEQSHVKRETYALNVLFSTDDVGYKEEDVFFHGWRSFSAHRESGRRNANRKISAASAAPAISRLSMRST